LDSGSPQHDVTNLLALKEGPSIAHLFRASIEFRGAIITNSQTPQYRHLEMSGAKQLEAFEDEHDTAWARWLSHRIHWGYGFGGR
jgi:hypothetical protein